MARQVSQILAHGAEMETYHPEIGTASLTIGLGAKPKLLFLYQWFAVLMGLACTAAALPVAALSFGCHGAAMLLGKVRPLREAYELFSRGYDRVIERIGKKFCGTPETLPRYD